MTKKKSKPLPSLAHSEQVASDDQAFADMVGRVIAESDALLERIALTHAESDQALADSLDRIIADSDALFSESLTGC